MSAPLWQPSSEQVAATRLTKFMKHAATLAHSPIENYAALHRWSIEEPDSFWRAIWSFCAIIGDGPGERGIVPGASMRETRFFPDARLNFAENLLARRDDAPAIIAHDESGRRSVSSFRELHDAVARLAKALRGFGVGVGDRVGAVLPNGPEAIIAMLATTSLGAIWSSCSPDFGARGVIDRFGQIRCKVLIGTSGYSYGGRHFATAPRFAEMLAELPSVEHLIVVEEPVGYDRGALEAAIAGSDTLLHDWQTLFADDSAPELTFERFAFDHPIAILYSSGTTGKPKCIVHGAGGTLLQHKKEHQLHVDLGPDDRLFYFTTCGWMMWNWLASALASGTCVVLYDGSPFEPSGLRLFELVEAESVTALGVSAKFIDSVAKAELEPGRTCDLASLRCMLSTGSPLAPEGFDFVYRAIKSDLQLASISGGTDIVSCFVLGVPTLPVWRGEIQGPGLGMAVEVFDDDGRATTQSQGELVCTRPFPAMPVGFWNDPDGARYHAAYFERFPGVWCHGDWISATEHGGYVISGRSDAVLNPGGVRIGTAEIYRQVEKLDEVLEGLAVGQEIPGDVRVVLFVKLREGTPLDAELQDRIRRVIRKNASPRHVPACILDVPDLPRTRSGKITELAVREVIHGRPIKNIEALANPEALDAFRDRPELRIPD